MVLKRRLIGKMLPEQLFKKLGKQSQQNVSSLFHGDNKCCDVVVLCTDIREAVHVCMQQMQAAIDINGDLQLMTFLKSTLPLLIEVLMRRKTVRYVVSYLE